MTVPYANEPLLSASATRLRADLNAFAREHLPEAMVPGRFVVLEHLPKLPNGKVDRSALPLHGHDEPLAASYVAPSTPEERQVAQIWCDVLGLARVGIHDSFFDLGGDSLAAAQMAARVKQAFGVALSLRRLFDRPSIAELVAMLSGKADVPGDSSHNSRSLHPDELFAEAALADDIRPQAGALPPSCGPYSRILLTGATGYTGAYLLRELLDRSDAQIYVLVRAADSAAALDRVVENMALYGLSHDADRARLIGVVGDIARPYFGVARATYEEMAREAEMIIHNGALSSYALPYKRLKAVNVLGTVEVLRLACRDRIKPVHFISSLAVFPGHDGAQDFAEVAVSDATGVVGGYRQSKWVGDRLVTLAGERGLPVCVYRPGLITGAQDTGACSDDTFLNASIKGCIQLGLALDFNVCLEMAPVDFCARAVAHIALGGQWHGSQFNLPAANTVRWDDLVDMLGVCGYPLERVPYPDWYRALAAALERGEDNALAKFFPLFGAEIPSADVGYPGSAPHFRDERLQAALAGSGIERRAIDPAFIQVYLDYFVATGYLPAANVKGSAP
ncbi:thioester reductase domain-containing protein [Massilia pseudoviolaceinigra]|uniref:thioester reductase domain-containing protein n=1 Tax=Massilia pseudoviolaceinigra TaxID=3057165 RepID=UPI00279690FA|nr:thioester reductase domain-containing protein [Massilia sp. CCM 9206]MDQ1919268.1 thioester reductase domain-containing protein [Massilia sp. CCM 9206]